MRGFYDGSRQHSADGPITHCNAVFLGCHVGSPRYHDYRRRIPEVPNCAEAYSQKVTGMLVLSPAQSCEVVPLTRIDLTRVQSTASDILH